MEIEELEPLRFAPNLGRQQTAGRKAPSAVAIVECKNAEDTLSGQHMVTREDVTCELRHWI